MLEETVDRESVAKMVHKFYTVILKDDLVGPYFIRALGDDITNYKWHEHLHTLHNFWLMLMNGEKDYWGDPFPPHAFLGQLYPETFERWLKLFNEVVHEFFVPEIANKFYKKSEVLANRFIEYLEIGEEENEDDDD